MSSFIFQSVIERYDLSQNLIPGSQDTWYATRYRRDMKPGDIVFFWQAGPASVRGVYGWGKLISTPYEKPDWDSHGVDVEYMHRLSEPLLATSIAKSKSLEHLLILRAPQATNFLLEKSEFDALSIMIEGLGDAAPLSEEH